MKTNKIKSTNVYRTLKIEVTGDRFHKKTCPKIRLQGKWLEAAGFKQDERVAIIQLGQGVMLLHCVPSKSPKDVVVVASWRRGNQASH